MSSKLERAAFAFAQSIRTKFANSVNGPNAQAWATLAPAQQRIVLALVEDAVSNGYAQAYPWLLEAYEAELTARASAVVFPDAALEQATNMVNLGHAGKRDFAAFTIVRNEPFFLELWCSYYGAAFGHDNLYVLDNGTDDDSVVQAKAKFPLINVVSVPSERVADWAWCTNVVKCFQRIYLWGHRVVVFADVDEYLIPETGETLRRYCEQFLASDRDYARAKGWGVVHQVDNEPILVDQHDVLRHRDVAWRAPQYDKTLISKVPLDWAKGSHTIYVNGTKLGDDPVEHDLAMVHLRDVDVNLFFEQCIRRAKLLGPDYQTTSFHGAATIELVRKYFRTRKPLWNAGDSAYTNEQRIVPETWKQALFIRPN
jgi:hypothetical protein